MIRLHPLITIICLTTITSAHAASHYQDTSKNTKDIIIKDKPNAIGIEADSHVTNSAKITIKNNRVRSDETIAIKSKQKITTTEGSQINIDTKSKNAIGILLENEKNHGPLIIDAHGEITVSNTQRGATNYGILSKTDSKDSNKISKIIYDDVNSDINIDANDSSGTGIMGSISNGGNLIIDVENIKQIRVNAQEAIGISAVADGDKVGNIDIELGKGAVDITSSSGSNGFGIKSINSSGGNNNIKNNFDIHSNYIGIYAENNKGGNIDVRSSGKIQVMTNGNIGILTKSSGPNKSNIIIAQSGEIVANGRGIYAENTTGGDITINNLKDGKILSLKDEAIKAEAKAGQITTNNDGIIQGYVTYSGKNVKFINQKHGILELLNNYDNGVTNDFGTNGKFENNGSIKFSWNPSNNTAIFKNVAKFYHNNTATIDIRGAETGNPITLANIGNTIEITNQGQGQFISNGGTLLVNTYIAPNGGKSDKLIIDNASTGSGGSTLVHVIPSTDSEFGKLTGDGIEIIQVKGHSSQDAFRLAAPVVNGEYEYGLVKGGSQSANSWFLRNTYGFNPAMGGYLANMRVATTLFSHTLHNRAIAGKANLLSDTSILQNLWLTTRIAHSHHHSVNNSFNNRDNTYMTQLGRDIALWQVAEGNLHIGIMGGYGHYKNTTTSKLTGTQATSQMNGYNLGLNGSWFEKDNGQLGSYIDVWSQYSWYRNRISGKGNISDSKKYGSSVWSHSIELGYGLSISTNRIYEIILTPQAQFTYNIYNMKTLYDDKSNLLITNDKGNGLVSRLGARLYGLGLDAHNFIQPYISIDWINSTAKNQMTFNGQNLKDDGARNLIETELGFISRLNDKFSTSARIGSQWGKDNYNQLQAELNFNYNF